MNLDGVEGQRRTSFNPLPLRVNQVTNQGHEETRAERLTVRKSVKSSITPFPIIGHDNAQDAYYHETESSVADHCEDVRPVAVTCRLRLIAGWCIDFQVTP